MISSVLGGIQGCLGDVLSTSNGVADCLVDCGHEKVPIREFFLCQGVVPVGDLEMEMDTMTWSRALRVLPLGLYHILLCMFFLGNHVSAMDRSPALHKCKRCSPLLLVMESWDSGPTMFLVCRSHEVGELVTLKSASTIMMFCGGYLLDGQM